MTIMSLAEIYFHESSEGIIRSVLETDSSHYSANILTASVEPGLLGRFNNKRAKGQAIVGRFSYWRQEDSSSPPLPKIEAVHPVHRRLVFTPYRHSDLITYGIPTIEERERARGRVVRRIEIDVQDPVVSTFDAYEILCGSNPPLVVVKFPKILDFERERSS